MCYNQANGVTLMAGLQGLSRTLRAQYVSGPGLLSLMQSDFEVLHKSRPLDNGKMHAYIRSFPFGTDDASLTPQQLVELKKGPKLETTGEATVYERPPGLLSKMTELTPGGQLDVVQITYVPLEKISWFEHLARRRKRDSLSILTADWQDEMFLAMLQGVGRMEMRPRFEDSVESAEPAKSEE